MASNNDVRLLIGASSGVIYYATCYNFKPQAVLDINNKFMNDAFSRKIEREKRDESAGKEQNEVQRGRGRVLSTLYTMTNKMATGLQLAAYYLLYGDPYICSHEFDMLVITHLMNFLNGRQQDMLISPTSFNSFRPKICDYLDRSDALENFNYTLWTALYKKASPGSKAATE